MGNIFIVDGKERIPPCPKDAYNMKLEDLLALFPEKSGEIR